MGDEQLPALFGFGMLLQQDVGDAEPVGLQGCNVRMRLQSFQVHRNPTFKIHYTPVGTHEGDPSPRRHDEQVIAKRLDRTAGCVVPRDLDRFRFQVMQVRIERDARCERIRDRGRSRFLAPRREAGLGKGKGLRQRGFTAYDPQHRRRGPGRAVLVVVHLNLHPLPARRFPDEMDEGPWIDDRQ